MGVIGQETARETRRAWRGRSLDELVPLATVALGLVLGAISVGIYIAAGYSEAMLWLWLGALVITAVGFGLRARTWPRIGVLDLACAAGAAALCAPFYLIALYRWPVQVSSDEAAIMDTAKQYATIHVPDPLGAGFYLTRPALLFIAWGKLGNALGGVDLFHMRLLHALAGLLAVAATYALFRLLMPRGWAFLASLIVGLSHAMFMISRLAMRENTAVLVLVVALALLLWGLRENHELATFLGGVVAGLGFYVYYPARIAFPIWVVFLITAGFVYRKKFAPKRLAMLGAVAAAGVLLAALPISYSESQVPAAERSGQTDGLMIYKTARETQKDWVFAHSQLSGYLTNVKYGLTVFNNRVVDHGWIYVNPGHGFVDPLTGILLWLGVGIVAIGLIRRRREDEGALLMLIGFLVLWLSFAFAVNKAPNYTRLLGDAPVRRVLRRREPALARRPVAVDPVRPAPDPGCVRHGTRRLERLDRLGLHPARPARRRSDRKHRPVRACARECAGAEVLRRLERLDALLHLGQRQRVDRADLAFLRRRPAAGGRPTGAPAIHGRAAVRSLHAPGGLAARRDPARRPLSARADPQRLPRRNSGRVRSPVVGC